MPNDPTTPTRVVLVGFGPVGARFVEAILPSVRAGDIHLTVVGAEQDAYNRVLLAEYAVGRATRERLDLADAVDAADAGVVFRLGEAVKILNRSRQRVTLENDEMLPYDRLVLATGARANVPTLAGLEKARRGRSARPDNATSIDAGPSPLPRGVVVLRDLADADVVRAAVDAGKRIVVLGAGVLGMELALAAKESGAEVSVVYHGEVPMARNLDRGGGHILAQAAGIGGVSMVDHSRAESVVTMLADDGVDEFESLVCADGKVLHGDLLVLSCGVGARTELASIAGLAVSTGILVDEELRSWTDPDIFAIGDCAHVAPRPDSLSQTAPGAPSGLIGPGWRQADWLARAFAAEATSAARPALLPEERQQVVMLKSEGVHVVSGGDVSAELWDAPVGGRHHEPGCSAREISQWADPARGSYVKMVTRDGVLEGFVAAGMPRAGAELTLLFERKSELPVDRSVLLRLDAPEIAIISKELSPTDTVCWCNGVTVEGITDAAARGNTTVESVCAATRAGTGCGGCKGRLAEVLASVAPVPKPVEV